MKVPRSRWWSLVLLGLVTPWAVLGHAFGHMDFLEPVGDPATDVAFGNTRQNLQSAIEGETYEYTQMTVNRFQGLDRGGVWLVAGGHRVPARFEEGHSKEEKMAAVHYLRFPLPDAARAALADPAQPAGFVVDHANYRAQAVIPPGRARRADLGLAIIPVP